MLPTNVLYYGRDEALPERLLLRAGPLSLVYEAGGVRYVKWGDREVLRRVYVAVRDSYWRTVAHRLRLRFVWAYLTAAADSPRLLDR